jgi:hypothetical protein
MQMPELTCTCVLHERKRELLVVVKVVQDVVIRIVGYNQLWRIPLGHLGVAN